MGYEFGGWALRLNALESKGFGESGFGQGLPTWVWAATRLGNLGSEVPWFREIGFRTVGVEGLRMQQY